MKVDLCGLPDTHTALLLSCDPATGGCCSLLSLPET